MTFTEPQPLTELIAKLDAKTPIGSAMRTAEWERVPQGLRDGAFFSAGVTHTQFLSAQQKAVTDMIARARETNAAGESMWKMDRGQFVKQLRQMGEALGVKHPDGREGGVKERDITDPISIARLELVVNTQLELAYGYGQYVAAMDEDVLQEWPAWELVRITPRAAPRDWFQRWSEAGGELHDGRMIALKTSPVWAKLSRFGNPHPPFDFNSGMGVEEVDRDTVESLGLMSMTMNEALKDFATLKFQTAAQLKAGRGKFNLAPDQQTPGLKAFQEGLEASVKSVPEDLRKKLKGIFKGKISIDGDTVKWAQDAPENDDLVKVREARLEPQTPPEKIPAKPKASRFEKSIANLKHERGRLTRADGTAIVTKDGDVDKITWTPQELAAAKDGVLSHNHPSGASFSGADVLMLTQTELRALHAVTETALHIMERGPLQGRLSEWQVMQAWNAASKQARALLEGMRKRGEISGKEMKRRLAHETMLALQTATPELLSYQRIDL